MEGRKWVKVCPFDEPLELNGWRITAHPLAESYVFYFIFENLAGPERILIAMDELFGWSPPADLADMKHPLTEQRLVPADHPLLKSEATFRQTLEMVETLQPQRLFLTHIEEPFGITPPEFEEVAANLQQTYGWDVTFAYDTLQVDLYESQG